MTKLAILTVLVILVCSSFLIAPARAQTTTCTPDQPCYFGYDTGGAYTNYPGPFPAYWQTTYNGQKVKVSTATITISAQGFPSQFSTDLIVDGKIMGSIVGGGTAKFQIKGDEVHTYEVRSYVTGESGERFYSKGNSWTSEKGKEVEVTTYEQTYIPYYDWWYCSGGYCPGGSSYWYYYPYYQPTTKTVTQPFDQSYTFRYEPEYELTVQNDFGGSVSQSGWYAKDSSVILDTKPLIQSSEDTRYVFVAWTINGIDVNNEQTTIKTDQQYSASAKYKKQYYVQVNSDYGSPTGSGWYDDGSKATIQVASEMPLEGFFGALGGKRIFDHWTGASSSSHTAEINVDGPKLVVANWRDDITMPALIAIFVVLAIAIVIIALFRPRIKQIMTRTETRKEAVPEEPVTKEEAGEADPLRILKKRYASGDISREEYQRIKKDLDTETEDKEPK